MSTVTIHDADYHLFCEQRLQNPYPLFARLRELDPVHWCEPFLGTHAPRCWGPRESWSTSRSDYTETIRPIAGSQRGRPGWQPP